MANTDPLLGLYSAADFHYNRLLSTLGWEHETLPSFLYLLQKNYVEIDFVDPASSFEADKAMLIDIEKHSPGLYTLGLGLYKGNARYARRSTNAVWQEGEDVVEVHAVALPQDGPPVLTHEFDLPHDSRATSLLPQYLASGAAEILSQQRAMRLLEALAIIQPEFIDPDSAY